MLPTAPSKSAGTYFSALEEDSEATPDAPTALGNATAHPEDSSSPPVWCSEAGFDREQVADMVEHPFLPSLFRTVAAAECVLLPPVFYARGRSVQPLIPGTCWFGAEARQAEGR